MSEHSCIIGRSYEYDAVERKWWMHADSHRLSCEVQFCPDCGTRFNSDGSTTPMCEVVTREAVAATRFMQVWESMDRTDAEFEALVELGLLVEDKDNRRGDAVRFFDNAPDAGVLFAALQQSGAAKPRKADRGELWHWYSKDIMRICDEPDREHQYARAEALASHIADLAAGEQPPSPGYEAALEEARFVLQSIVDRATLNPVESAQTWLTRHAAGEAPPGPDADAMLDALDTHFEGVLQGMYHFLIGEAKPEGNPFTGSATRILGSAIIAEKARALLAGQAADPATGLSQRDWDVILPPRPGAEDLRAEQLVTLEQRVFSSASFDDDELRQVFADLRSAQAHFGLAAPANNEALPAAGHSDAARLPEGKV